MDVSGYPMALPRHSKVGRDNSVAAARQDEDEEDEEEEESSGWPLLPSLW